MRHFKIFLLIFSLSIISLNPISAFADTWAIYLYLCGSDLETKHGSATNDLLEIDDVDFSKNVKVIVQTGGSKKWVTWR
ncbi:MAG: hypothetical protein IJU40_06300 [Desulfovibrionaceae bacterium]|nr:hypothetical protein [Desulfovibrionaceae bacterium]